MPMRPENRWNTFLVVSGLLLLIYPAIVAWKHETGKPFTTHETLVGGQASILIVAIVGFIGMNLSGKKTRHDLKNHVETVRLTVQDARLEAQDAKQVAKGLTDKLDRIEQQTNGNLERAIRNVGDEVRTADGMIPFSEARKLIQQAQEEGCAGIAQKAADLAAAKTLELYLAQTANGQKGN